MSTQDSQTENGVRTAELSKKKRFNLSSLTIIILVFLLGLLLSLTSSTFLSANNIFSILYGVSINFFGAIGFTYLMIMGELDLSVGSVFAFSGMMTAMFMKGGMSLAPALILSIMLSTLFGLINGYLVVRFRVSSMMITLGTMTAIRGLANLLCSNLYGYPYSNNYQMLAKVKIGDVYLTVYIMILLAVILEIMLNRMVIFRKMYYVGENIDTARIYGIKSGRLKIVVFTVSAFLSSIGGILIGARLGFADTTIGSGLEFTILTAVVLGGGSLSGGKGSILRTCFGLIFLSMISNGMVIHNIDPLVQQLIVGIILILAVFLDTRISRTYDEGKRIAVAKKENIV